MYVCRYDVESLINEKLVALRLFLGTRLDARERVRYLAQVQALGELYLDIREKINTHQTTAVQVLPDDVFAVLAPYFAAKG